eukprot:GHUV01053560.1.p1 GENE.GHUV01053560.1~~GHUV01053560.1.p1  ORF type:complete len:417 (+),score=114.48 GHUV01053560.1:509-1759(+)
MCCMQAPMENLADRPARIALKETVGGFDEACTEFIRVPGHSDNPRATTRGITASYDANELGEVPLAAQLMGSNIDLLAAAAERLVTVKGAPRIDLNCGCPANVVTGGGAGSSLLRDPDQLHEVVRSLVAAVGGAVPVTVKMRSGFDDTSLYEDNLLAVQEAGAAFVTIHPRTKQQSYNGRADWSLIASAKQLLSIPVVGNGDIVSVASALAIYRETGCDGLMIGRGALQDPLLFRRIKAYFAQQQSSLEHFEDGLSVAQNPNGTSSLDSSQMTCQHQLYGNLASDPAVSGGVRECDLVIDFLKRYAAYGFDGSVNGAEQSLSQSGRIGRLKKVMKYIFSGQPELRAACCHLLRVQPGQVTAEQYLQQITQQVELHWQDGGPPEQILVNHVTMPGSSKAEQTWQAAHSTKMLAAACV